MKEQHKEFFEKFGLNVAYYRISQNLTQLQLAELINVDCSLISDIELGKVDFSFDVVFKMCEVFKITPKELFDFRD